MDLLIFATGLSTASILLVCALVLCGGLVLHWGHHHEQGLVPFIFYPILVVYVAGVLLNGKSLNAEQEIALLNTPVKHPVYVALSRATSLFILFAVCERFAKRWFSFGIKEPVSGPLLVALGVYFSTNVALCAYFATHQSFSHEYVYAVLIGFAVLLMTRKESDAAISALRNALLGLLAASLAVAPFIPDLVFSRDYQGIIPIISVRYSGLAAHPNSLGALTVTFLLCLTGKPLRTRGLNRAAWTLGLLSLVLSQSKTSWAAFLICISWMIYFRQRDKLRDRLFDYRAPYAGVASVLLVLTLCSVVILGFLFGGAADSIASFAGSREGAELLSMTGRDQIWAVAIEEWRKSPLFGYGLTIWDRAYRLQINMPFALHAHNQFFQSLSSSGLVGAAGLSMYVLILLVYSIRTAKATGGLSLAVFTLLFIRSVSEIPLSMVNYGAEQLVHFLLLITLSAHAARVGAGNRATERTRWVRPVPQ